MIGLEYPALAAAIAVLGVVVMCFSASLARSYLRVRRVAKPRIEYSEAAVRIWFVVVGGAFVVLAATALL